MTDTTHRHVWRGGGRWTWRLVCDCERTSEYLREDRATAVRIASSTSEESTRELALRRIKAIDLELDIRELVGRIGSPDEILPDSPAGQPGGHGGLVHLGGLDPADA